MRQQQQIDITFLVNAHREGPLLLAALRSARAAQVICAREGVSTEIVVIADAPDDATSAVIATWCTPSDRFERVAFRNLGSSRKYGIELAVGTFVCFLDGDDIWQDTWPLLAYRCAQADRNAEATIYHTEIFAGFGLEFFLRKQIETTSPLWHPNHLVAQWLFCNNLFARRSVLQRFPIQPYDHTNGLGPEDLLWSCETCFAGIARRFVPRTVYFYRMDPTKPSLGKTGNLVLPPTPLFRSDPAITTYASFIGTLEPRRDDITRLDALAEDGPVPSWLIQAVHAAATVEFDLWLLVHQLPRLTVRTPKLRTGIAHAFGEMRRLYDERGPFGIVAARLRDRPMALQARLERTIVDVSQKLPLVVLVERELRGRRITQREGNILYIDIGFLHEIENHVAHSQQRLIATAAVQFEARFLISVGSWLGDTWCGYMTTFQKMGIRVGCVTEGAPGDIDSFETRDLLRRMQNGSASYREIWLALPQENEIGLGLIDKFVDVQVEVIENANLAEALRRAMLRIPAPPRGIAAQTAPVVRVTSALAASPVVSCILNIHREGDVAVPTLCSIERMLSHTIYRGVDTELVIVLDDPDEPTQTLIQRFLESAPVPARALTVSYRELGASRNHGIREASGEYIALLDADDLYSRNWLLHALEAAEGTGRSKVVVHPALNVFFGRESRHFWSPNWDDELTPSEGILLDNYWTSLCFAPRLLFQEIPYEGNEIENRLGFEDWHWSLQVLAAGGTHVVAPETAHFIRLKDRPSLNRLTAERNCLIKPSRFVTQILHRPRSDNMPHADTRRASLAPV